MKATDKQHISPLVPQQIHGTDLGRVDQTSEVKPTTAQPLGHTTVDLTEQAPVRLVDMGPASSVVSTGQSSQVALRAQRTPTGRGAGVRTKKLKTENVTSMARIARAMFQGVLQTAQQGAKILADKQAAESPSADAAQSAVASRE